MREKISVVMPVHNTGAYLREALESLVRQTFVDFEVICVNDASDDEYTNEILKSYEKKDERIFVYWLKESVGAGKARNLGFKKAVGEYIIFLDADDIFRNNMLEQMYMKITEENAEVCHCGFRTFKVEKDEKIYLLNITPVIYNQEEGFFSKAIYSPWTRLCKMEFLKNNNIYFQSLPCCNDVFFSSMVYLKSKKQCLCEEYLVEYRTQTKNQISANRDNLNFFKAMELLLSNIECETNAYEKRKQIILSVIVNAVHFAVEEKNTDRGKEYYNTARKILTKNKNIVFNEKVYNYYYNYISEHEYNEKWFFTAFDYYKQFDLNKKEIRRHFEKYNNIILWGAGKRGGSFQRFCKDNNLNLIGVTDSKNESIGDKTSYGYSIIHTNNVFKTVDAVFVSNSGIYDFVKKINNKIPLINLQEYSPVSI